MAPTIQITEGPSVRKRSKKTHRRPYKPKIPQTGVSDAQAAKRNRAARRLHEVAKGSKTGALSGWVLHQLELYLSKRVPIDRKPSLTTLVEREPAVEALLDELMADSDSEDKPWKGKKTGRSAERKAINSAAHEILVEEEEGEGGEEEVEDEGGEEGEGKEEENVDEQSGEGDIEGDDMDTEIGGVPLPGEHLLPFRPAS